MRELLLGCGSRTVKDISFDGKKEFVNVTRLDNNADHKPDVVHDLTIHPLPFSDNSFDEIHCYEVLEHLAQQGDYEFFFHEFSEYARILKPDGFFMASCPAIGSPWVWGDPSHKRCISKANLVFLDQDEYTSQVGKTPMSDFRYIYKAHFKVIFLKETKDRFYFALQVKK